VGQGHEAGTGFGVWFWTGIKVQRKKWSRRMGCSSGVEHSFARPWVKFPAPKGKQTNKIPTAKQRQNSLVPCQETLQANGLLRKLALPLRLSSWRVSCYKPCILLQIGNFSVESTWPCLISSTKKPSLQKDAEIPQGLDNWYFNMVSYTKTRTSIRIKALLRAEMDTSSCYSSFSDL
jgi:hypothetical protein